MLTLTRDALLVSQSAGLVQLSHGWYFSAQRRRCGLEFSAQMTPFLHWFNVGYGTEAGGSFARASAVFMTDVHC